MSESTLTRHEVQAMERDALRDIHRALRHAREMKFFGDEDKPEYEALLLEAEAKAYRATMCGQEADFLRDEAALMSSMKGGTNG